MSKTGKVSWKDSSNSGSTEKVEFMRLSEGSNLVRFVSDPYQYQEHTINREDGRFGYRVKCAIEECPACEETGTRPKKKYMAGIIDRKTGQYKVLDFGGGIFNGINVLANDPDWGFEEEKPCEYDMSINKNSKAPSPANFYSVNPKPKAPLSPADVLLIAEHPVEDLVRRTTPPTPEQVRERMAKMNEKLGMSNSDGQSKSASDDADEDNFFKEYKSKTA